MSNSPEEMRVAIANAKAEVLEEAARDLSWLGAQGNTVEPNTAWAGVCACITALGNMAKRIREETNNEM